MLAVFSNKVFFKLRLKKKQKPCSYNANITPGKIVNNDLRSSNTSSYSDFPGYLKLSFSVDLWESASTQEAWGGRFPRRNPSWKITEPVTPGQQHPMLQRCRFWSGMACDSACGSDPSSDVGSQASSVRCPRAFGNFLFSSHRPDSASVACN